MKKPTLVLLSLLLSLSAIPHAASEASLTPTSSEPLDISGDGTIVTSLQYVVYKPHILGLHAYFIDLSKASSEREWKAIPTPTYPENTFRAHCISRDGSFIGGSYHRPIFHSGDDIDAAYLTRNSSGGYNNTRFKVKEDNIDTYTDYIAGVSQNGLVHVGNRRATASNLNEAWVALFVDDESVGNALELTSYSPIPTLEGETSSTVLDLNETGETAVGYSGLHAFRWEVGSDTLENLGSLPGLEDQQTVARAISPEGSVIVGNCGNTAFIWNPENGIETLPAFDDQTSSVAYDVSRNGRVIVGSATLADSSSIPVFWNENGIFPLSEFFENPELYDLSIYRKASAVSDDGYTIIGGYTTTENNERVSRGFILERDKVITPLSIEMAILLRFPSESGKSYDLQRSTNLTNWTTEISDIKGDGTEKKFFFELTTPTSYYRLLEPIL